MEEVKVACKWKESWWLVSGRSHGGFVSGRSQGGL